jgi:hypothetical protein
LVGDIPRNCLLLSEVRGVMHPNTLVVQIQKSACTSRLGSLASLFSEVYFDQHNGCTHHEKAPRVGEPQIFILNGREALLQQVDSRQGIDHDDAVGTFYKSEDLLRYTKEERRAHLGVA